MSFEFILYLYFICFLVHLDSLQHDLPMEIKQFWGFNFKYGNAAIRVATQWYQNHLGGAVKVLLITNDRENKRKASEEGIFAETGSYISWHLKCMLNSTSAVSVRNIKTKVLVKGVILKSYFPICLLFQLSHMSSL